MMSSLNLLSLIPLFALVASTRRDSSDSNLLIKTAIQEWPSFKLQYNKQYDNSTDEEMHMKAYIRTYLMVQKHNRKNGKTYRLGINSFSDMTPSESDRLVSSFQEKDSEHLHTVPPPFTRDTVPDALDWNKEGNVSPVREQVNCNSCFAISVAESIESQLSIKTEKPVIELSPQELIDCVEQRGHPCEQGGSRLRVFKYVIEKKGLMTERDYPYEDKLGRCRAKESGRMATSIYRMVWVESGNEEHLKTWLANVGPVSVEIWAKQFSSYSSGVFKCSRSEMQSSVGKNYLHAMLVVGYGKDTEQGEFWLLKNSWGTDWGENGFMRLARNQGNQCNVASRAYVPEL